MITFGEVTPNRTISGSIVIRGLGHACKENDKAEYVSPLLHERWKISLQTSSFYESGPRHVGVFFQYEGSIASETIARGGVYVTQYELKAGEHNIASGTLDARRYTPGSDWGHRKACKMTAVADTPALKNEDECVLTYRITEQTDDSKTLTMGSDALATTAMLAWAQLFNDAASADTCFIIHHPSVTQTTPREIFAHSKYLAARLPYFAMMFKSDFHESSGEDEESSCTEETCIGWDRDADSDYDDTDNSYGPMEQCEAPVADLPAETPAATTLAAPAEIYANTTPTTTLNTNTTDSSTPIKADATGEPMATLDPPVNSLTFAKIDKPKAESESSQADLQRRRKTIHIHDAAYRTYRALLLYLYTGAITFPPEKGGEPTESTAAAHKDKNTSAKATLFNLKDTTGIDLPSANAKSVYRVADKLDVPELLTAAKQQIIGALTPENVIDELSTPFSRTYPAIRKEQFAYLKKHWSKASQTTSLKKLFGELFNHEPTSDLWIDLFKDLRTKKGSGDGNSNSSSSSSSSE